MKKKMPALNEIFAIREWRVPPRLNPKQEEVVAKWRDTLVKFLGGPGKPVPNDIEARVADVLRGAMIDSERAEGESEKEIEK